ncbi:MAG: hypothetical protein SF123_15765 [Chloroflexota bacterium]|nr:hypothetical protein [Chloroflexota bacterium]
MKSQAEFGGTRAMKSKRRRLVIRVLIGIVVVVLIGCGIFTVLFPEIYAFLYARPFYPTYTAEELCENPLPLPYFIYELPTNYDTPGRLCPEIDTYNLWIPSDGNGIPVPEVAFTASITINGTPVSRRDLDFTLITTFHPRYGASGELLGAHGGPIVVCARNLDLPPGLHVATFSFRYRDQYYQHQWAFRVES